MGYIVNSVSQQLNSLRIVDDTQRYNQPIITIGTLSCYLIINDENHYWWSRFEIDVTTVPTLADYYFTGNLVIQLCMVGAAELQRRTQ